MVICIETDENNIPQIQLGQHLLRLDAEELGPKDKKRAEEEIRETPENVRYGLAKIREYIEAEPDFNVPLDDDDYLTKFLRPCRYIPENAFKIMKRYYYFKVKYPKYGFNITPASIRQVFDTEVFKFLPTRTSTGCRIMTVSVANWDPKKVTMEELFKAVMVSMEIAMLEPKTQLGGVHVILDTAGLSLMHIYQFSPSLAKVMLEWIQECVAVRLKGIHILNQPLIFNMGYKIFKPFLGERIKKLLFFHGQNRQVLLEHISPEALTPQYGGTADIPDYPGTLFSDMLFYYEEDFQLHNTYGYKSAQKKIEQ
ncbi:alpha-tocopherol transfer protein-like [Diabrotica undecimpunctata]|uniref:alpha-tocopherol transfer protein-like n=1 Tax=Diabrotica undecimpunctata TaxID=50387 RepID=UPI003B63E6EA